MKIGIVICEKVNGRCSTMGCFNSYNNKSKHFSIYKDIDIELSALFSCDICSRDSTDNIIKIAKRLKEAKVETIHLGACLVKCKAGALEDIKKIFTSNGINIVEGTH